MPKKEENKLRKIARTRGYGNKRTNAFVFGTLRKEGWKPKTAKKRKRL